MEWTWKTGNKLLYLTIPEWTELGIAVGFSTRGGGESKQPFSSLNLALHVGDDPKDIWRNRNKFLAEFNIDSENCVTGEQVHGTSINRVMLEDRGRGMKEMSTAFSECDGLVTQDDIGILCFFADCVPIYFFNPEIGMVGLAHAGWKGTANNIVFKVIEEISLAGGLAKDTFVAIGPCIKNCCYEIGPDVADSFIRYIDTPILQQHAEKYRLDLSEANRALLVSAGIRSENMVVSDYCTACHPELFYSYRRDGLTGRMAAFIMREKRF